MLSEVLLNEASCTEGTEGRNAPVAEVEQVEGGEGGDALAVGVAA